MSIADQLIIRGWTKYVTEDGEGRVCLRGALMCELYGNAYPIRAEYRDGLRIEEKVLNPLIAGYTGSKVSAVPVFNDSPFTTFDDVLCIAKQADEILSGE